MKSTNFLPILTGLVALTSCQIGPNYYELESPSKSARVIEHKGYHGAHGCAYRDSTDAVFLVRDLTDEELIDAGDYPGKGYDNSQWSGANSPEIVLQYFDCEDGSGILIDDEGDIHYVKLHLFEAESGRTFIFNDETGEVVSFRLKS